MSELLESEFRQTILPIVATTTAGEFKAIGTGFIFCARGRYALMFSAAHIFRHVERMDQPYDPSHPTTPLEFRVPPPEHNLLTCTDMHALFRTNDGTEYMALIPHAYPWANDTAVCVVELGTQVPQSVSIEKSIVIDTTPPVSGTQVLAVGYSKMQVEDTGLKTGAVSITFRRELTWRPGRIIEVFPTRRGSLQPWPCFQTDIPFDSGMSGGPILKNVGDLFVACGVINSDSTVEGSIPGTGSGLDAIASMLWPSMGITIEEASIEGTRRPARLVELQQRNFIHDLGNASGHITIQESTEPPDFRMVWRP
jgi:hypothetical protein